MGERDLPPWFTATTETIIQVTRIWALAATAASIVMTAYHAWHENATMAIVWMALYVALSVPTKLLMIAAQVRQLRDTLENGKAITLTINLPDGMDADIIRNN